MSADNYDAFSTLSDELKTEFYSSFKEALEELDNCFDTLNCGYQEESVHEMFRAVHSVKGNCHMVFLDGTADVCHHLEELVSEIRAGTYRYIPICGEFITFVFLRLEQLIADAIAGEAKASNNLEVLGKGIRYILDTEHSKREEAFEKTLESFAGILSSSVDVSDKVLSKLETQEKLDHFSDIEFMSRIAEIMQAKSVQHQGDRARLLGYCLRINSQLQKPVNPDQLTAAFYMQHFGSRLVTSPIFDITAESPQWERDRVAEQLELAGGFLKMGEKWVDAALMIEQCFERYDGKGVPGLHQAETINSGGMILALVRFFQQGLSRRKRREESEKRVIARTLRRINSEKGYRFNPEIVDIFNRIVHKEFGGK